MREDLRIDVVISETDGLCAFSGDYFDTGEANQLLEFVKKLGYKSDIINTDRKFRDNWTPFRKITHRDIDWTDPRVIFKIIQMQRDNKTDEDIIDALHSESTSFAIITHSGRIWKGYSIWRDTIQGEVSDEMIMEFCKSFVKTGG
jgi:hypothetical protein